MGVALYPEFEKNIPGYNPSTAISGKTLARSVDGGKGEIERLCHRLGVRSIFDFYSESNEEAFAKLGEPVPPGLPPEEPLKWSEPAEGLRTVEALLACPDLEATSPRVSEDLRHFRDILLKASEHGTRFRLRIDM
jgi:hypothetical protein